MMWITTGIALVAIAIAAATSEESRIDTRGVSGRHRSANEHDAVALRKGCKWVDEEYRDDVRISTCDAVATVSVRAMSFGPGFCAVEIRTGTIPAERVGISAPPAIFSGWMALVNHLGVYSVRIVNDVKCDTGVRTQVRYSAPE